MGGSYQVLHSPRDYSCLLSWTLAYSKLFTSHSSVKNVSILVDIFDTLAIALHVYLGIRSSTTLTLHDNHFV